MTRLERATRHMQRLSDPRWIAKRAEILRARGRDCESCGAKGGDVDIHHGYYSGDRFPWDYEDETLHVLCATCHGKAQALMVRLNRITGELGADYYEDVLRAAEAALREQDRERAKAGLGAGVLVVRR